MSQIWHHPTFSMEGHTRPQTQRSSSDPAVRLCTVTNENWRGKNDPTERRRIQNRLNQRAFRQRQRSGEHTPRQYRPRNSSAGSASSQETSDLDTPQDEEDDPLETVHEARSDSAPATSQSSRTTSASTSRVWDELGQLINRNFLAAVSSNARLLGVNGAAIQNPAPVVTPRPGIGIPSTLQPIQAQTRIPHDPIIDAIPHPRLRYNILRAIASQQIDGAALSRDLRASGALENAHGTWQRCGLVVWGPAPQLSSWELSEAFLRRWGFLLQGCEDLLAATNVWRGQRGERLFPQSVTL